MYVAVITEALEAADGVAVAGAALPERVGVADAPAALLAVGGLVGRLADNEGLNDAVCVSKVVPDGLADKERLNVGVAAQLIKGVDELLAVLEPDVEAEPVKLTEREAARVVDAVCVREEVTDGLADGEGEGEGAAARG